MQAVHGAATDPAFIPGITGGTGDQPAAAAEPQDAVVEDRVPGLIEPEAVEAEAVETDSDGPEAVEPESVETDSDGPDSDGPDSDGPVFEAADRRARIVADATGVRLSLDEESCEFRWDEIGAVETATGRFGKRFTVVVHTPNRRWYTADVDATSKDRVKEWESLLDAVLDAYFDENAESTESAESAERV